MGVQGRASVGVWTATGAKIGFIGRDKLKRVTCNFGPHLHCSELLMHD